jgi:hypothetical protein
MGFAWVLAREPQVRPSGLSVPERFCNGTSADCPTGLPCIRATALPCQEQRRTLWVLLVLPAVACLIIPGVLSASTGRPFERDGHGSCPPPGGRISPGMRQKKSFSDSSTLVVQEGVSCHETMVSHEQLIPCTRGYFFLKNNSKLRESCINKLSNHIFSDVARFFR